MLNELTSSKMSNRASRASLRSGPRDLNLMFRKKKKNTDAGHQIPESAQYVLNMKKQDSAEDSTRKENSEPNSRTNK